MIGCTGGKRRNQREQRLHVNTQETHMEKGRKSKETIKKGEQKRREKNE
jgi:hypothetical protein